MAKKMSWDTLKHFDNLTAIDYPLGELDDDTAGRLMVAGMRGAKVQVYNTIVHAWVDAPDPQWTPNSVYRLAPAQMEIFA